MQLRSRPLNGTRPLNRRQRQRSARPQLLAVPRSRMCVWRSVTRPCLEPGAGAVAQAVGRVEVLDHDPLLLPAEPDITRLRTAAPTSGKAETNQPRCLALLQPETPRAF
jgi:hypothetical protein